MKIKTSELIDKPLDWAVCLANGYDEGWLHRQLTNPNHDTRAIPKPSTDWSQGGPIIERLEMEFRVDDATEEIVAQPWDQDEYGQRGPTHLVAAMRCYVASKLGDEVDIPEGLL